MEDVTGAWRRIGDVPATFAHVIRTAGLKIVGLAGAPGSGKSTIARSVIKELGDNAILISQDDFYLSKTERASRGLKWRGPPGSHDLASLIEVLDRIREGKGPLTMPRFSAELDDRVEPTVVQDVPEHVLLEGWVIGHRSDGYEEILDRLDLLAFLEVDDAVAKLRRFGREAKLRESGGGFSEQEMQQFWDEVLEPGMSHWVRDARADADLVIALDPSGRVRAARTKSAVVMAALAG
jgi:uridine kinase